MTQIERYVKTWNENRVDWLYQLARCEEISPSAVRLGLLFATFLQAEKREEVRPNFNWLVKNAHMSRGTVAKAMEELEAAGFIKVRRFHAESNHYSMTFDGNAVWKRARVTPYVPKQMKNPPKGRRNPKTIESKN